MHRSALVVICVAACGSSSDTDPEAVTLQVTLSASSVKVGDAVTASAAAFDADGAPVALPSITWSSARAEVATVDSRGTVTPIAAGDADIEATGAGLHASASLHVASDPTAACRLPGPQLGVGFGFPRVAGRLRSTGDVRVAVLFVDFSDAVASRTPQNAFALISPGAEQFYTAVSDGHMHLILDPLYTWLRMSKPTSGYPWNPLTFAGQKAYLEEAIQLAGTSVDFASADAIAVISNPDSTAFAYGPAFTPNPGDGVLAGGKRIESGATSGADLLTWGPGWFNHEFGHTLGLPDLYELGVANPQTFHYTGDFSMMSNILGAAPEYLGWERWQLGWLDDAAVVCAPAGHSAVTLTPVEVSGGSKLVVVPTGATTAVVIESRHAVRYDHALADDGLLVYFIDTSLATGHGVAKVLPIDDNDLHKHTLRLSETLTYAGVTVTFTAQDAAGDHVDVSK